MPTVSTQGAFEFEPSLSLTLLPRCPSCGHKHPGAYNPPLRDLEHCPACGGPAAQAGAETDVPVAVTDRGVRFGIALLRAGAWLTKLARRM